MKKNLGGNILSQEILIQVKNKIAETNFDEVVSYNSVYRLRFSFDEEWSSFPTRVAVVTWAGGAAEQLFSGTECEMPLVYSSDAECVLVGVYAQVDGRRIASSFVRIHCRAGAGGQVQTKAPTSLHDQILDFLNERDWSIFEEKVLSGVYSAVRVNPVGLVTEGWNIIEIGSEGQTLPSSKLASGGVFFCRENGVYTPYYKSVKGLEPLKMSSGKLSHALHIGDKSFDGSKDVEITAGDLNVNLDLADVAYSGKYDDLINRPAVVTSVNGQSGAVTVTKYDLGLPTSALTGSYNDLKDKPTLDGVVTSVNGQTGAVVVSKNDLGLPRVALTGSYNDLDDKPTLDGTVTSVNGQTGAVAVTKYDLGLPRVALTGSYNDLIDKPALDSTVTSVNGQTGAVAVTKYDLGLPMVALTGKYKDLLEAPDFSEGVVTSVNGKTGKIVISKSDLGLGMLTNDRQLPHELILQDGANFNTLQTTGIYHVRGTAEASCINGPISPKNASIMDCNWLIFVIANEEEGRVVQFAFSERSDCAFRIRVMSDGAWSTWKVVV